jgi:hypothetical protein
VVTFRAGDAEFLGRLGGGVDPDELMQCDFRVFTGRTCSMNRRNNIFRLKVWLQILSQQISLNSQTYTEGKC